MKFTSIAAVAILAGESSALEFNPDNLGWKDRKFYDKVTHSTGKINFGNKSQSTQPAHYNTTKEWDMAANWTVPTSPSDIHDRYWLQNTTYPDLSLNRTRRNETYPSWSRSNWTSPSWNRSNWTSPAWNRSNSTHWRNRTHSPSYSWNKTNHTRPTNWSMPSWNNSSSWSSPSWNSSWSSPSWNSSWSSPSWDSPSNWSSPSWSSSFNTTGDYDYDEPTDMDWTWTSHYMGIDHWNQDCPDCYLKAFEDVDTLESLIEDFVPFNFFGFKVNDAFRYMEGYISGLISYDVSREWNQCMNGIDFFLSHVADISKAVLTMNIHKVFTLLTEVVTQGFSKIGQCHSVLGEEWNAFKWNIKHMFTIWFTLPKNLMMNIFDPTFWQYPKDWFQYTIEGKHYSAGNAWGKMMITLLD